jgi:hypothetical protein
MFIVKPRAKAEMLAGQMPPLSPAKTSASKVLQGYYVLSWLIMTTSADENTDGIVERCIDL